MPTTRPMTTVRGCSTSPLSGMSTFAAFMSAPTPAANPQPHHEADERGEDAHREGLDRDAEHDLASRGAEGAEHGELASPLRHRHREGVEDDEGADEHGDAAEARAGPG